MKPQTIIMDFSHVYEQEDFYRNTRFVWVDCSDIAGTSCYCTPQAADEIRRRIRPYSPYGIHFIDSGDYHYVSAFWMEKIEEPFHLLLFDYHSDMQPPKFPGLLSCGCWVQRAMDENRNLRQVWMVGPDESAFAGIAQPYRRRLQCISLQALQEQQTWVQLHRLQSSRLPVYVSIDKDVLNTYFARTDWSQGGLSLPVLEKLLGLFESRCRVLGVDVCGEWKADARFLLNQEEAAINNQSNLELLRFLLRRA
ncbi:MULTISPECIES: arginase family protein [Caproicibacterium]|uniref:Arginase family protein n=1 Tax=Caproicibacterium argilliputei TaxID=3030016 RepID=A0AA97D8C5_9FIRM|nr:arginase family protein [Caproicibacterium argilliputei]WOC32435.1 arginase family protein [Caproicibacterium argilliputei]